MTDPGLDSRLRQRSRRSGIMIGFSMLLTLMVCVGGFTVIFTQLEPVVSDFVGRGQTVNTPTPVPTPTPPPAQPTQPAAPTAVATKTETPTAQSTGTPGLESLNGDEFSPDYQLNAPDVTNLREGPGTSYDTNGTVPLDEPLMYLGEAQATENPSADGMAEGDRWMRFRLEDGREGWLREIDVTTYEP